MKHVCISRAKQCVTHAIATCDRILIRDKDWRVGGRMLVLSFLSASLPSMLAGQASASPGVEAASNAPARTVIAFAGEVRTRSEWDAPHGGVTPDLFTYLRTRFGVRVDTDAGVRLVLQGQDSRVLGAEGHVAAATVEEFGLHQAYLELQGKPKGLPVAFTVGRQEIAIGNERLVGSVGWSNTGRSFDGARVTVSSSNRASGTERWSATAFAATVEERGRHFGTQTAAPEHDHVLAGAATTLVAPLGARVDVAALYDAGNNYRQFTSSNRATVDVRLRTASKAPIGAELEVAWQGGRQRDHSDSANVHRQQIAAWLAGVRVGRFALPGRRTSLVLGVDRLSGDDRPHDARYGSFSTMYGSNHVFYGLMDAIGDPATTTRERGLVDVLVTGATIIADRVAARAEAHRFSMASGAARDLGWEADVVVPVRVLPTTSLDLGFSVFRAGANASDVGLGRSGTWRDWAFLQLRVGF